MLKYRQTLKSQWQVLDIKILLQCSAVYCRKRWNGMSLVVVLMILPSPCNLIRGCCSNGSRSSSSRTLTYPESEEQSLSLTSWLLSSSSVLNMDISTSRGVFQVTGCLLQSHSQAEKRRDLILNGYAFRFLGIGIHENCVTSLNPV